MHFATLQFAYFLAVTLTVSWLIRRRKTAHKLFLLLASYFFYARLNVWMIGLLAGSSIFNWAAGELMRFKRPYLRKLVLGMAIAANLGLLGTYKYYNFFQQIVTDVASTFGLTAHLPLLELAVPVGLSFFTFQGLAYVVDLYRGKGLKAASALDFLLFTAFYPKLLSGPICRARDLLPQIVHGPPERVLELPKAVSLIASGLFKKAVLATLLGAHLVEDAFIAPENYSALALWMAAYAYSIQLYCDFSGYTDMARGVALLYGYRLPENFSAPYAATDPGLFWKRWHATFSSWLRDYLYFPLGGSKGTLRRTFFNLMVTWTASGLWHGATWGYVIWGAIHGLTLCLHKLVREWRRANNLMGREPWWYLLLGWFATFHIVVFSRIVFRAGDLETAGNFFVRMVSFAADGLSVDVWVVLASAMGFALNFVGRPLRDGFVWLNERTPWALKPILWAALGVALLAVKPGDVAPYIYFQF